MITHIQIKMTLKDVIEGFKKDLKTGIARTIIFTIYSASYMTKKMGIA